VTDVTAAGVIVMMHVSNALPVAAFAVIVTGVALNFNTLT